MIADARATALLGRTTPFVIAEIGVNHDGDPRRACLLVEAAAEAGADAVKLQHFITNDLMSGAARLAEYQRAAGECDPLAMLRRLELPLDDLATVRAHARAAGLPCIVTVFSTHHVATVEPMGFDAYKTASPDLVHRPLLDALAATGRPLILSTGAATMDEVRRAVGWLERTPPAAVLHCISAYPTPPESAAIGAVAALREMLPPSIAVGYSDHTMGDDTGALAVALGATVLEKHITLDRTAAGPDHAASLEPGGFARYVAGARTAAGDPSIIERYGVSPADPHADPRIGPARKSVLDVEGEVRLVSRQSIVTTRAVRTGEALGPADVTCKRPGLGLEPWRIGEIIGRTISRDIAADTIIMSEDLA